MRSNDDAVGVMRASVSIGMSVMAPSAPGWKPPALGLSVDEPAGGARVLVVIAAGAAPRSVEKPGGGAAGDCCAGEDGDLRWLLLGVRRGLAPL